MTGEECPEAEKTIHCMELTTITTLKRNHLTVKRKCDIFKGGGGGRERAWRTFLSTYHLQFHRLAL